VIIGKNVTLNKGITLEGRITIQENDLILEDVKFAKK